MLTNAFNRNRPSQTCRLDVCEKRAILIAKNREIKTRDVSHCVSSLLPKLAMLAPTNKIAKFLEELRMPCLLVQPFPACYSVRAKWDQTDVINNDRRLLFGPTLSFSCKHLLPHVRFTFPGISTLCSLPENLMLPPHDDEIFLLFDRPTCVVFLHYEYE